MPQDPWRAALDRLGLVAYVTIVSGELPDSSLLSHATGEADTQRQDEPADDVPVAEAETVGTAA